MGGQLRSNALANFFCYTGDKVNTIKMPNSLFICSLNMPTPADSPTRDNFDYASLDAITADFVQQQTSQIRILMRRTAQDIVEIGQRLVSIKEKLGHGYFLEWLVTEFDGHRDTANKFMQVAKEFGNLEMSKISTFEISALYKLATPSTPQAARDEAIARAAAGESITYSAAQQIRSKYTSQRSKRKPLVKETLESPVSTPPETVREPDATPEPDAQNPALEKPHVNKEILAILPQKAQSQTTVATVVSPPAPVAYRGNIATGSWWQLAERHLLYCGSPNSGRFLERLPDRVSLQLAFPLERNNWLESVEPKIQSALCLWSSHKDEDQKLLLELVERALLLYTEGSDTIVFLFLPDPQLLMLAHGLECKCLIAEPDLQRCQKAIAAAQMKGMKPQRLKSVRF